MAEPKTKPTKVSVNAFLDSVTDGDRRTDCATLVRIMKAATGAPATMWGPSIIGFGLREVTYAGGRIEEWPAIAFSLRKQDLTLYVSRRFDAFPALLAKLGKHKMSGSCLYIKRLSDVDRAVLGKVVAGSVKAVQKTNR
jgi:hypothetical protein